MTTTINPYLRLLYYMILTGRHTKKKTFAPIQQVINIELWL